MTFLAVDFGGDRLLFGAAFRGGRVSESCDLGVTRLGWMLLFAAPRDDDDDGL